MRSLIPRSSLHRATARAFVTGSAEGSSAPPETITAWLARLGLLYGVPFEYLVPDYRMLPPESIRWGFLDENWTALAIDGAMAVGRSNTATASVDPDMRAAVNRALPTARSGVRPTLRRAAVPAQAAVGGTVTVMLIRSAVVGGYPGMEIRGLDSHGQDVELLRYDHLAKDVAIAMFAELPATVELLEPPEGLHFGVRELNGAMTTLLRSLQPATLGQQVTSGGTAVTVTLPPRSNSASNVLDVVASMNNLVAALQQYDGFTGTSLSPADMAIELVRAAGVQRFVPGTPTTTREEPRS